MKIHVHVFPKKGVLDPQGKAIAQALQNLGFSDVGDVRQGKLIELEIKAGDSDTARERAEQMCQRLLANTVVESYRIEVLDGHP